MKSIYLHFASVLLIGLAASFGCKSTLEEDLPNPPKTASDSFYLFSHTFVPELRKELLKGINICRDIRPYGYIAHDMVFQWQDGYYYILELDIRREVRRLTPPEGSDLDLTEKPPTPKEWTRPKETTGIAIVFHWKGTWIPEQAGWRRSDEESFDLDHFGCPGHLIWKGTPPNDKRVWKAFDNDAIRRAYEATLKKLDEDGIVLEWHKSEETTVPEREAADQSDCEKVSDDEPYK